MVTPAPYYQHHVFFCVNQRAAGKQCCADHPASELRDYAKRKLQELNLHGAGKVRINQSGCLDRCAQGPVLVVYPEGVWYQYTNRADIDEIIARHLQGGEIVARLRI